MYEECVKQGVMGIRKTMRSRMRILSDTMTVMVRGIKVYEEWNEEWTSDIRKLSRC